MHSKFFSKILFGIVLLLFSNLLTNAQTTSQIKLLDSTLTVLHRQAMFNGVVLVAEKGKVIYQKALGISNITTQEPLKMTSSFNLASVSKQFVAMMVMQLKEKGKLNYDDAVSQYLPEFPYEKITIRQLLTHTSGLPEYFDLAMQHTQLLDTLTNAGMLQLLNTHKPALHFMSGSKWEYCNTGYVLLGSIIEKVSGMSVADFFREQIAKPLQLQNTYVFHFKMREGFVPKNRVYGFKRENGKNISNDLTRLDGVIGDGNIYASAEDLLKWEQALYTEKLVKKQTLQEAFIPVKLSNDSTFNYGFGWFIKEDGKVMSHTGSWVGFLNEITHNTQKKLTIIVLTNSSDNTARQAVRVIMAGKKPHIPATQLITNIKLIDGLATPARQASVRLKDNQIWEIGTLEAFPNENITDGKGYVLAPGFIDSHSHHTRGLEKNPQAIAPLNQGITTIVSGQDGSGDFIDTLLARLQRRPVAINLATYTGHSSLRVKAMGARGLFRTARPDELEKMKTLLQSEMEKGSLGLSTGLEYESAFFSDRNEVLELARETAKSGGRYISHIRSEDITLEDAIDEIINIGRVAQLPVQVSHIKIAKRDSWGTAAKILTQLQQARNEGINITADCYPYDFWMSTLRVLFPKRDYTNPASAEFAVSQLFDPEKSVLTSFAANRQYAGKTVSQIAQIRNEKPSQTLMTLIADAEKYEEKYPDDTNSTEGIMGKSMDEPDVIDFLSWANTNICSDGAISGHPRGYGAFTRVLGRYVRELKIMSLETAIHKMTALTAEHLGLHDRGLIAPGYFADLVLFDPETVKDNATIQDSKALSSGIVKVWVNGVVVLENQQTTGKYPGVFIKRPSSSEK
jgi:N-acyl-D-aspartate/D-glutamate deacylase/CubicO group peptidase (beta-lactamase class C family)